MIRALYILVSIGAVLFGLCSCERDELASRDPLSGISQIQVARGYSGAKVFLTDSMQIDAVVSELNQLRKKPWKKFVGKPGACSMHLVFYRGDERQPFNLLVHSTSILEIPLEKGTPRYLLDLEPQDIPQLKALLIQIGLSENCRW